MNCLRYTPVVTNIVVVSNSLRSTLTWSKFQHFPVGACPQTPLEDCACSVYIALFSGFWATHCKPQMSTREPIPTQYVCPPPPFFNLWIHPCRVIVVSFTFSLGGVWDFHPYMHLFLFRKLFCDFTIMLAESTYYSQICSYATSTTFCLNLCWHTVKSG